MNAIAMVIGLISIAFGAYGAFTEMEFKNYGASLFIGLVLFGTGYINNKEWQKKSD